MGDWMLHSIETAAADPLVDGSKKLRFYLKITATQKWWVDEIVRFEVIQMADPISEFLLKTSKVFYQQWNCDGGAL